MYANTQASAGSADAGAGDSSSQSATGQGGGTAQSADDVVDAEIVDEDDKKS